MYAATSFFLIALASITHAFGRDFSEVRQGGESEEAISQALKKAQLELEKAFERHAASKLVLKRAQESEKSLRHAVSAQRTAEISKQKLEAILNRIALEEEEDEKSKLETEVEMHDKILENPMLRELNQLMFLRKILLEGNSPQEEKMGEIHKDLHAPIFTNIKNEVRPKNSLESIRRGASLEDLHEFNRKFRSQLGSHHARDREVRSNYPYY